MPKPQSTEPDFKLPKDEMDEMTKMSAIMEFLVTDRKARMRVMQKVNEKYYEYMLKDDPTEVSNNGIFLRRLQYVQDREGDQERETPCVWITINPDNKKLQGIKTFQPLVEKAIKKKWIQGYMFVYEQRGTPDDKLGEGIHCHMLIFKPMNKRPSEVKREFQSTFNHVIGNSKHLEFKFVTSKEVILQKVQYMAGVKSEDKMDKVYGDMKWREATGLLPFYKSDNFDELLSLYSAHKDADE